MAADGVKSEKLIVELQEDQAQKSSEIRHLIKELEQAAKLKAENQTLDEENVRLNEELKDSQNHCSELEERVTKLVIVF